MARRSNILFKSVGAAALLLGATSFSAQAADLPVVQPASHDWTGPYIGAIVGVGGRETSGYFGQDDDSYSSYHDLGALGDIGFVGGGTLGWNFQSGNTVFGIEGDYSLATLNASAPESDFAAGDELSFDTDYFATIRGRIGVADNDVLLYITGGVAFAGGDLKNGEDETARKISVDSTGGVVGAGIEWAASRNLSVKIEGLYAFFDDKMSLNNKLGEGFTDDYFKFEDMVVARLGVNWNFNASADDGAYEPDETTRDWTGPYVGALVGAGVLTTSGYYESTDDDSLLNLGSLGDSGLLGGGTVGWNIQNGNMVFGMEGDISFANWSGFAREGDSRSEGYGFDADLFATARGRVGYADGDLLIYGTAGVAFLDGKLDDRTGDSDDPDPDVFATGGVFGVGMEWAASEQISVKVEGLYVSWSDFTSLEDRGEGDTGDGLKLDDSVVARLGVNWNFR